MLRSRVVKIVLLLLISLWKTTSGISQDISTCVVNNDTMILITPEQLKLTNLIFNEHFELKITNKLQLEQIESYKQIYQNELKADSLYEETINNLKVSISQYESDLAKQKKKVRKKNTFIGWLSGYGIAVSIALLCIL